MTTNIASERKFLTREELALVEPTHYPQVADADADALREARSRLRDLRGKAQTVARHRRRESKGKGPSRAGSASGTYEHAARRKQIFSQALRRASRQLQRIEHAEARARTSAGAQRALALKRRAEGPERPIPNRHASTGMRANPSLRRAMGVPPGKIGSVSQAGRDAQAKRDTARRDAAS